MPTVLAQSNLPKSAAVVVSSETIVLRDPDNNILEKYTSEEQRQKALKSYGIKPATLLSPGENKVKPKEQILVFYDWLQNDNAAYINTLLFPRADYKYEIDVEILSRSTTYPFGVVYLPSDVPSGKGRFSAVFVRSGTTLLDLHLYFSTERSPYTNIQSLAQGRHSLVIENGYVSVDGGESVEMLDFDPSLIINNSVFIFAENNNNTAALGGMSRLYSFKVSDSLGNLLLDLKPATLDDTPGLYDSVSSRLFENANSDGAFLIGNIGDSAGFGFGFNSSPEDAPNEEI